MEYTILIIIKTEGFRSSEKVRLGLLNWSFEFNPKISYIFFSFFIFHKFILIIMTSTASRKNLEKKVC